MNFTKTIIWACVLSSIPVGHANAANACAQAFPTGATVVLRGTTTAGIKNKFSDDIMIALSPLSSSKNGTPFSAGSISSSRTNGELAHWRAEDDVIWGNQCLILPEAQDQNIAFLALSWDPHYHHPNVHGLLRLEGANWVFRGYLDNAAQQYHEAALTLSWPNES